MAPKNVPILNRGKVQDPATSKVQVMIPESVRAKLMALCGRQGVSMRWVIQRAIEEKYDRDLNGLA
jgi:hypothetical protein